MTRDLVEFKRLRVLPDIIPDIMRIQLSFCIIQSELFVTSSVCCGFPAYVPAQATSD